jgi:septum formation protein
MNSAQLVLASASPRRQELLDQIGISYIVKPVCIDEQVLTGELADTYVRRVTALKAAKAKQAEQGLPVLAADTAVVLDGNIMGKPQSQQDALNMLGCLSGRTHRVYSAVSLWGELHRQMLSVTEVSFRTITEAEMLAYWHSGEPVDKAGAYAIQGLGSIFVRTVQGSYSGVMGLPLFETAALLNKAGIKTLSYTLRV